MSQLQRDHVRAPEGLARRRHRLKHLPNSLVLRRLPRCDRRILAINK